MTYKVIGEIILADLNKMTLEEWNRSKLLKVEKLGVVAQLGEQHVCTVKVESSSLSDSIHVGSANRHDIKLDGTDN